MPSLQLHGHRISHDNQNSHTQTRVSPPTGGRAAQRWLFAPRSRRVLGRACPYRLSLARCLSGARSAGLAHRASSGPPAEIESAPGRSSAALAAKASQRFRLPYGIMDLQTVGEPDSATLRRLLQFQLPLHLASPSPLLAAEASSCPSGTRR